MITDEELKNVDVLRNEVFKEFVENTITSVPLRLKVVDKESDKGKISEEDFEFLKDSIMSGLFFDFVDLWHTILKQKFEEEKEGNNYNGGEESENI